MAIEYRITIGSLALSNRGLGRDVRPLAWLESAVGMGGAGGECVMNLGQIAYADPQIGNEVTVELDAGDGAATVFTGEVTGVVQRVDALFVTARDGLSTLARLEVEGAYEEVSVGFIVRDLIDQAGNEAGQIEEGPTLPSYVVHRGPRALRHVQQLGRLIGADLYTDGQGKIHFQRPADGTASHQITWGEDLVAVDLQQHTTAVDSVVVWGEGAAGTHGPERSHWLPTDLSGVQGQAAVTWQVPGQPGAVSSGSAAALPRSYSDGAVRSAESAGDLARARAQALALRPIIGEVQVLGRPEVLPGEWVDLRDMPAGEGSGSTTVSLKLRIRRVQHHVSTDAGLLTRLEF